MLAAGLSSKARLAAVLSGGQKEGGAVRRDAACRAGETMLLRRLAYASAGPIIEQPIPCLVPRSDSKT